MCELRTAKGESSRERVKESDNGGKSFGCASKNFLIKYYFTLSLLHTINICNSFSHDSFAFAKSFQFGWAWLALQNYHNFRKAAFMCMSLYSSLLWLFYECTRFSWIYMCMYICVCVCSVLIIYWAFLEYSVGCCSADVWLLHIHFSISLQNFLSAYFT